MRAVSDLDLERFLVSDLDDADQTRVAAAIAADPELAAWIQHRRDEQARFARRAVPLAFSPGPLLAPAAPWWRRALDAMSVGASGPAMVAAGACGVLLVVLATPTTPTPSTSDTDVTAGPVVRARGALPVSMVVHRGDNTFRFDGRSVLKAGDAVRLEITAPDDGHVVVVAVDDHARAQVLYDDVSVQRGTRILPESLVLDDSEGVEHWIVAFAHSPINAAALARRATLAFARDPVVLTDLADARAQVTLGLVRFEKEPSP